MIMPQLQNRRELSSKHGVSTTILLLTSVNFGNLLGVPAF
jgi:hypothetical protein